MTPVGQMAFATMLLNACLLAGHLRDVIFDHRPVSIPLFLALAVWFGVVRWCRNNHLF